LPDAADSSSSLEEAFEVIGLELWGGGGEVASRTQKQLQLREEEFALQRRKVNRQVMVGEGALSSQDAKVDMAILEMSGAHKSYVHESSS